MRLPISLPPDPTSMLSYKEDVQLPPRTPNVCKPRCEITAPPPPTSMLKHSEDVKFPPRIPEFIVGSEWQPETRAPSKTKMPPPIHTMPTPPLWSGGGVRDPKPSTLVRGAGGVTSVEPGSEGPMTSTSVGRMGTTPAYVCPANIDEGVGGGGGS